MDRCLLWVLSALISGTARAEFSGARHGDRKTDRPLHELLKPSNLAQAAEIADQIYKTIGTPETLVVGIGRSPTIFVEFLRAKHDLDVDFLPISKIKRLHDTTIYKGLTEQEQAHLHDYFDQHIPRMAMGKKRLVFLDCSATGTSVRFMARELSGYLLARNINVELIVGSIESPMFQVYMPPGTSHFHIVSKDKIHTSFRLRDADDSSNLMTSIAFSRLDQLAPHPEMDIRRILRGDVMNNSSLQPLHAPMYAELRRTINKHVRRYPYLSYWAPKVAILRTANDRPLKRLSLHCQRFFARLRLPANPKRLDGNG